MKKNIPESLGSDQVINPVQSGVLAGLDILTQQVKLIGWNVELRLRKVLIGHDIDYTFPGCRRVLSSIDGHDKGIIPDPLHYRHSKQTGTAIMDMEESTGTSR